MLDGMPLIPLTKAKKHRSRREERCIQTHMLHGDHQNPKKKLGHEKIPKTNTK
jgi:hypothetical protein